jgi:hypothetical protein
VDSHAHDDGKLAGRGRSREDGRHLRAGLDAHEVEQAEKNQGGNRRGQHQGLHGARDNGEVDDPGQSAQRRGQEVVDKDQKAAHKSREGMDGSRRDRDHAAALRVADGDLGVLDAEEDEDEEGHRDEESGVDADLPVEDSGRVIHGGPDVGEDDRPAEKRAESASRPRACRCHLSPVLRGGSVCGAGHRLNLTDA